MEQTIGRRNAQESLQTYDNLRELKALVMVPWKRFSCSHSGSAHYLEAWNLQLQSFTTQSIVDHPAKVPAGAKQTWRMYGSLSCEAK